MSKPMKSEKPKQRVEQKVLLQGRILYRSRDGEVTEQTDNDTMGLNGWATRSSHAKLSLLRVNDLLQLLALAVEDRSEIDAAVVRRVLEEVERELEEGGDLGCYVLATQELFEDAEALPPLSGAQMQPASRTLALVRSIS